MTKPLPRNTLFNVSFDVRLPVAATPEEVLEWVRFAIGIAPLPDVNPLGGHDLEAWNEPVLRKAP